MNEKRPIVRCKNAHGFLVMEGEPFDKECPYCEAPLMAVKNVYLQETYNLHFIHVEQERKSEWKVKRK